MSSFSRVGLFGGTFDPLHNAHLEVSRQSIKQQGLDKVIFIPSKHPPHKGNTEVTEARLRYRMVELVVNNRQALSVSPVEINREGPSYTVDTLRLMKDKYEEIMFIVGADNLINIDTWKAPEELLETCPFLVAPRGGIVREDFKDDLFRGKDLRFLNMSEISLSSTEVRNRISEDLPIDGLVPSEVLNFIVDKGLYKKAPAQDL